VDVLNILLIFANVHFVVKMRVVPGHSRQYCFGLYLQNVRSRAQKTMSENRHLIVIFDLAINRTFCVLRYAYYFDSRKVVIDVMLAESYALEDRLPPRQRCLELLRSSIVTVQSLVEVNLSSLQHDKMRREVASISGFNSACTVWDTTASVHVPPKN